MPNELRLARMCHPHSCTAVWSLWLLLCACGGQAAEAGPIGGPRPSKAPGQTPQEAAEQQGQPPAHESAAPGATPSAPSAPDAIGDNRAIEQLIERAIAEGKLPGAVIAYGGGRRGLEYLRAFGHRALVPEREPMTTHTIFDLASLSKAVLTGIVAMQLVERGALDLEARVSEYLAELRRPATRAIRVRELLLHTAGLPRVTPTRALETDADTAIARLLSTNPENTPGERFRYGDTAYLWLGILLERISSRSLAHLGARGIAAPLGLTDTHYGRVPDHSLDRTAPTEWAAARGGIMIRGKTHDPRAFRLGGQAGNAGVFSTATDVARLARALLLEGQLDGQRILSAQSVARMTTPRSAGQVLRAYGWDVLSGYSRLRGKRLGARAFGHGGFTGTSLWIDPGRDLFVVFLSHRVHPEGGGRVLNLIGEVTDAAVSGRAAPAPVTPVIAARANTLQMGIDRLALDPGPLRGRRVGLVVNRASLSREGHRTLDILHNHPAIEVVRVFAPEHGLAATREGLVADGHDTQTGLPVVSLFGKTRKPTASMVADLDTLVFDLQDVGVRFFTYMSTLHQLMAASKVLGRDVMVLDRPNPIGAAVVEGPVSDASVSTFVHYHPLPVRHGMTAGELANLVNATEELGAKLKVVWMRGYCRELTFAETGLAWTPPSPNLKTERAALLYPAVGLLESTNVSVGRGSDTPFEVVGAPWLRPAALLGSLRNTGPPGVEFEPASFTPQSGPYRGQQVPGIRLSLVNRDAFRAVDTALVLAHNLAKTHGSRFRHADLGRMLAHRDTLLRLTQPEHYRVPTKSHILGLASFMRLRKRHLHYPSCGVTR